MKKLAIIIVTSLFSISVFTWLLSTLNIIELNLPTSTSTIDSSLINSSSTDSSSSNTSSQSTNQERLFNDDLTKVSYAVRDVFRPSNPSSLFDLSWSNFDAIYNEEQQLQFAFSKVFIDSPYTSISEIIIVPHYNDNFSNLYALNSKINLFLKPNYKNIIIEFDMIVEDNQNGMFYFGGKDDSIPIVTDMSMSTQVGFSILSNKLVDRTKLNIKIFYDLENSQQAYFFVDNGVSREIITYNANPLVKLLKFQKISFEKNYTFVSDIKTYYYNEQVFDLKEGVLLSGQTSSSVSQAYINISNDL